MRIATACYVLMTFSVLSPAQQAAPAATTASSAEQQTWTPEFMKTFTSAAEVQTLIAQAKAERKDNQPMLSKRLLSLSPYNVSLEYRPGVAPAALHPTQAEMFYVIEGAATFVTGGKIVDGRIEGGNSKEVAKGDFYIIPENIPHYFSTIKETLVVLTFHLNRPMPGGDAATARGGRGPGRGTSPAAEN